MSNIVTSTDRYKRSPVSVTILPLAFLVTGAPGALAQSHMAGRGGQSCGAWTANSPSADLSGIGVLYQQWVLGFLSGVGRTDPKQDPFTTVPGSDVTGWLDTYCRDHPGARIVDAASAFAHEHHPRTDQ